MACNILYIFLSVITREMLKVETNGLWCFFMVYLTQKCLQEPDTTSTLWFIPYPIQNKYYPLAFILLFWLLAAAKFDMLIGYLVALAHFKYLDEKYHGFLNTARISSWEKSDLCSWLQGIPSYIRPPGADPTASEASNGSQTGITSPNQQQQTQQPVEPVAERGIATGGSDANESFTETQSIMDLLKKPEKNYKQLDAGDDDDDYSDGEDDIESQAIDSQTRN